jgi:dolichol-phosphate mannosyltransferase
MPRGAWVLDPATLLRRTAMPPIVSIVIPVYQNEGSIETTCRNVARVMDSMAGSAGYEFVLVNDGSTDRSWERMKALQAASPGRYTVISLTRNFGQLSALLTGYAEASGDCVVSMSADGQEPAETVGAMVEAWLAGHKLVVGTREERNDGWLKDRVSEMGWMLLRRYAVPNIPRGGFDFFLMDREVRDYYVRDPEQNIFMQGRLLYYGVKPHHIPYSRLRRTEGKSETGLSRRIKYFIDGFTAYSFLPLRLMSIAGIALFLISLVVAGFITWYVLLYGSPVMGWASLMCVLLFIGGIQLMCLGVLGEYLWRGLQELRRRPHYVVETILRRTDRV